MEPVTHLLTGACLARAGFHRRIAYATVAMAVGAEFPDIDTLWSLRGPVAEFQHHRGLTHTFLGVPFEAAFLLLLVFLWHRWRLRAEGNRPAKAARKAFPPVRWVALYGSLLLALLSHLLLDYTNNYGVRPFFPFNERWYAGSIVFIFDPLLFLILLSALVLPVLFGLISREIGARGSTLPGVGWARVSLCVVVLLWGVRSFEHERAVRIAGQTTLRAPSDSAPAPPPPALTESPSQPGTTAEGPAPEDTRPLLQSRRVLADPDPLSIFRWYTVTDFGPAYQLGVADSARGTLETGRTLIRPIASAEVAAAERSPLGRAYLDWSPLPYLVVDKQASTSDPSLVHGAKVVWFADPRYMGDTPLLHRGGRSPLTGEVVLAPDNAVLAEGMDGRFEH